jgi:hypothetical protein
MGRITKAPIKTKNPWTLGWHWKISNYELENTFPNMLDKKVQKDPISKCLLPHFDSMMVGVYECLLPNSNPDCRCNTWACKKGNNYV